MGKLTDRRVATIRTPGFHPDGDNLYLRVRKGGARYWALRITVDGTRREFGLGPYPELSLADARDKARRWKGQLYRGVDPREAERRDGLTIERAARQFFDAHRGTWSDGHAARWWASLDRHVFPRIGDQHLSAVSSVVLLDILGPAWTDQHETAKRLLQRIAAIYEHAAAAGLYDGGNPTTGLRRALPKVRPVTAHFEAMDWKAVPEFHARLVERDAITARALRFIILTACRSGEVRGASWDEIDLEAALWTIPAERMKSRRPHEVPLAAAAVALLEGMREYSQHLVFASPQSEDGKGALSSVALDRLLQRMGAGGATPHGFRTSFRSWAADQGADRELAELCLAHRIGSEVEQAYQRSSLLDRRRVLMDQWARYVTSIDAAKVVQLRGGR